MKPDTTPITIKELENEELEDFLTALEKLNYLIGIEESIEKITITATDPQGKEEYNVIIEWNEKKHKWIMKVYY